MTKQVLTDPTLPSHPRPLIEAEKIHARVRELGKQVRDDYQDKTPPHLIGVLKGCFMFMTDLVRAMDMSLSVDFIAVSSYGDATQSSGAVQLTQDLTSSIEDRHVILVEDIVDTGLTIHYLREYLLLRHPASLKLATLLSKPSRREVDVPIDYLGFEIPDQFVIGYGLDYAQRYRNLPYVGVLEG